MSYALEQFDQERWHCILDKFEDASVYQTMPFCTERVGTYACEHLVLTKGAEIVSVAQVRLMKLPYLGKLIAYVLSGPLFHRRSCEPDWEAFGQIVRALKIEYVGKRNMILRLNTLLTSENSQKCMPIFQAEGFSYLNPKVSVKTMIVDLTPPLECLRKGLEQKWRNCLNRAEKNGLEIIEGNDDVILARFLKIYHEMSARKQLPIAGDIKALKAMQSALPAPFKMQVILVLERGETTAGVIISGIGKRGIYLFGATADSGMKNKASYLAQWCAIQWLKKNHCTEYDLNGVNAEFNPGVYNFKNGLCGRNGKEVEFLGFFEAHDSLQSRMIMATADFANQQLKSLKSFCAKYLE